VFRRPLPRLSLLRASRRSAFSMRVPT